MNIPKKTSKLQARRKIKCRVDVRIGLEVEREKKKQNKTGAIIYLLCSRTWTAMRKRDGECLSSQTLVAWYLNGVLL